MSIAEQIETILDKRLGRGLYEGNGRLQQIETRINTFKRVKEKLEQLDALISVIQKQKEQQQGEYYVLLSAEPEAAIRFNEISCSHAKMGLNKVLEALQNLKSRFEREAIRIAFIGYERQGKSTFLQSITGLSNNVIPAYDGTSCTGAVSIIHNTDSPFRAEIELCTVAEFIDNLKSKLKGLFPNRDFVINNLNDIKTINIDGYIGDDSSEVEGLIRDKIIDKIDIYSLHLGQGKQTFTDEDEIAKLVAQYREYDTIPKDRNPDEFVERIKEKDDNGNPIKIVFREKFYEYLAVKSANIYCSFKHRDCGNIELVDTVGLGATINPEGIEREMFRVLREDCDAAINVFCPAPAGGALNKSQKDIFKKINSELSTRDPRKWIAYAINGIPNGSKANLQNIEDVFKELERESNLPFGFYKEINAANREDVNNNLLIPLLEMITQNIDELDDNLMLQAEELVKEAFNDCLTLVKSANAVTSVSVGHNASIIHLFDADLFAQLSGEFNRTMNQVDQLGYAQKRESKCDDLEQAYLKIIDNIDLGIPSETKLMNRLQTGAFITDNQLFDDSVEQMRSRIFTLFEEVNADVLYPLQEKVKSDLIEKLFEEGRMKYLPVKEKNEPNTKWLQAVIDDYIDEKIYPYLNKALRSILDYQISIEGMVEYNVTRSLYQIDRTHNEYIRYNGGHSNDFQQRASNVWQELCNRLTPISRNLESWISDFTLIPSHSFYSRVHKFHVKVCSDNGGVKDFRKFYCDNMGIIWGNEITNAAQTEKAFGAWSERVKEFQSEIISDNFKLR